MWNNYLPSYILKIEQNRKKMAFETGRPKSGGRARGVENKNKLSLKSKILSIVENQIDSLEYDLENMDAKDKLNIVLKLIEYVLPKQRETKIDFNSLSDDEIDSLINKLKNE